MIFLAGVLIGISFDDFKINDIFEDIQRNEIDTESYYAEQLFTEIFGGDKCELAKPRVDVLSNELIEIGQTLTRYESKNIFREGEYTYLKQKYFLLEIKLYMLLKELREQCDGFSEDVIILYFYDQEQDASLRQGFILDSFVKKGESIHVFSIDRNCEGGQVPLVETVKKYYNITKSPTLIINYNVKKEGFVSAEELEKFF